MELQQLRYFVSVAELKHFTKAAKACRVAQPSLSQQIKKLEAELGSPLFHRQGRNIVLTECGHALLPRAQMMLSLHDNTVAEMNDIGAHFGTVRFGIIQTMAPYVIPYMLNLHRQNGLPNFEIHEDFTENLLQKLSDGQLDFAVMSSPIVATNLLAKVIAREPFVAVVPSGSELTKLKKLKLSDLKRKTFLPLSRIHCAGKQIHELCKLADYQQQVTLQSFQIETILRLVSCGDYTTVVPLMAMSGGERPGVVQLPLANASIQREITIVQHPDRYQSKASRELMNSLSAAIRDLTQSR